MHVCDEYISNVTPCPRLFDIRCTPSSLQNLLSDCWRQHMYTPIQYPCHTVWICFRSSTTYTLGTILRVCIVSHVAPDATEWGIYGYTHWQPILTLPYQSHPSYLCGESLLLLSYVNSRFLRYVACSVVSKSFCFHSNGQNSLPTLEPLLRYGCYSQNSDHVIHPCGAWPLGRLVSCRHLLLIFSLFFLRLYSVSAAIDSDTRCSYNRSCTVQQTNLQLRIFVS